MGCLRQLGLLITKNAILRRQHWILTLVEVLLPVLVTCLLLLIRTQIKYEGIKGPTYWKEFDAQGVPSKLNKSVPVYLLAYTPNSPLAQKIILEVHKKTSEVVALPVGFASESEMVTNMTNVVEADKYLAGIVFNSLVGSTSASLPPFFSYTLRFPTLKSNSPISIQTATWETNREYAQNLSPGPRSPKDEDGGPPNYFKNGFLYLQSAIDRTVQKLSGWTTWDGLEMERMPYPKYRDDRFVTVVLGQQQGLFLMLAFIFLAANVVSSVTTEKEKRLKELMKMMGLRGWLHWTAWYINFIFLAIISCALIVMLCYIETSYGKVLPLSDPSTMFVFLLIYVHSIILSGFAITTVFDKSRTATTLASILYFLSYMPMSFLSGKEDEIPAALRVLMCILPTTGFALGCSVIQAWEIQGSGLQWSNIGLSAVPRDTFTMGHVMGMLALVCLLSLIFIWYVENVRPGEFGIPLPWYFPCTKSYWCGRGEPQDMRAQSYEDINNENIESDPEGLQCSIALTNLTKDYGNKTGRKAVNQLNLRIFEGQITALLGHNGAGKTTTMHMITGFIPPTSGSVVVKNLSIRKDTAAVRKKLGLCPQHNVLFDELTVEQHLWFFAKLKETPEFEIRKQIDRMIKGMDLEPKRHAPSSTLSGGQKRKLNVAIALIGSSEIVVLDEPSSGMDPNARRELWTFLQTERASRTMLLSTHFMDEADALGDRIAIMAFGELQCLGAPLFLKSRFGSGYHLKMVKLEDCDVEKVEDAVKKYVPEAQLESEDGDELSFVLPEEASPAFEQLFSHLENNSQQLGIASFGASVTTMEEVFLKVCSKSEARCANEADEETRRELERAMEDNKDNQENQDNHVVPMDIIPTSVSVKRGGGPLLLRQFGAVFVKRAILSWRSVLLNLVQIIIPIVFLLIGLLSAQSEAPLQNEPALNLTLDKYGAQSIAFARPRTENSVEALNFTSSFYAIFKDRPQTAFYNLTDRTYTNESAILDFLVSEGSADLKSFKERFVLSAFAAKGRSPLAFFNGEAIHSAPIALSAATNARLRSLNGTVRSLATVNHPLPKNDVQKASDNSVAGMTVPMNLIFGLSILVGCFCYFVVLERGTKVKHLHYIAGTNSTIYWLASFTWDFINFLIPVIIMIILIQFLGEKAFNETAGRLFGILLLFVLYAWASLPQMYCFSFLFNSETSAIKWMMVFNFFTGFLSFLLVFIFLLIDSLKDLGKFLKNVFYFIFPGFGASMSMYDYSQNYKTATSCTPVLPYCGRINASCCADSCGSNCLKWTDNILSFDEGGIGLGLLGLGLQGIFYFFLCFLLDSDVLSRICSCMYVRGSRVNSMSDDEEEDEDVKEQKMEATLQAAPQDYKLVIRDCSRYYGSHCAVRRISCVVAEGECFGLLGVNGAGKTTTFKMLTGDLSVSSGDIFINGISVSAHSHTAQQQLGYCPQFDALLNRLTGREFLTLFSRLRGRQGSDIKEEVDEMIGKFLLSRYANNQIETYSGGNKRKLSTATAMIGNPPVVCLDEPTTGMDTVARRHLWQVLTEYRRRGNTLVLTSHSMEECEALCTKIAIMVNGQFKCFGSCQHLKDKFGRGFSLYAKLPFNINDGGDEAVRNFKEFVTENFPSAELRDEHQGLLQYQLHPNDKITWSNVFGTIERNKEDLRLENYVVSQTTLDQIFIQFARSQLDPGENGGGCCNCFS